MVSHVALGVTNQPRSCHTGQANMALAWDLLTVKVITFCFIEVRGKDDTFVFRKEVAKIIIAILVNDNNGHPTNHLSGKASQVENASNKHFTYSNLFFQFPLFNKGEKALCVQNGKEKSGSSDDFPSLHH